MSLAIYLGSLILIYCGLSVVLLMGLTAIFCNYLIYPAFTKGLVSTGLHSHQLVRVYLVQHFLADVIIYTYKRSSFIKT